ncbi:MAG: thiamine phosphate synthase [Parvularculaceae bacterium]|nr:thiamine phosphate synthase [Parvularculaceae bacterium]
MTQPEVPPCRLYLITPPSIDDIDAFAAALDAALGAGDVACLQLRLKGASDDMVLAAAARLAPVAHAHGVYLIVNDRPDLARAAGADGVHVGQGDASYAEARAVMGEEASVGVTCHNSRDLAMRASEAGADYVAFGAFFPTRTKDAPTTADPELLVQWSFATTVPCVAIGGINADNCGELVRAGADFIAVCAAVWDDPDGPAAAVARLNAAINNASK